MKVLVKTVVLFLVLFLGQGFCVHAEESVFEKDGQIYLIQSAQDMRTLALLVNTGKDVEPGVSANSSSYRLTRDIDLSAYCTGDGWEPVGCGCEEGEDEVLVRGFNGTFDGANHVVTGLYINCPGADRLGLFGTRTDLYDSAESAEYPVSGKTVIKNLYIRDCDITGSRYVGGIMGGMEITSGLQSGGDLLIENCHVTGKITGFDSAGGITGAASVVENCSFTGTVEAYSAVGGIVGIAYDVRGCVAHAKVEGGFDKSGGDAGGIGGVVVCVRDSYMVGAVTGTDNIGGITGRGNDPTGCYARADVTGDNYTGELLGRPQEFSLDGVFLPEGVSCRSGIQNCLTGGEDITDFQEFMAGVEDAGQGVWFCVADDAYPNLSWEKESRFGYTVTATVQEGDSLWKIADKVYGNGRFWTQIYEENQAHIGKDPSLLTAGTDLEITVNTSQADYASKGNIWEQEQAFLEEGKKRGLDEARLRRFFGRLLADDIWNSAVCDERERQINDWVIGDLDGNGQDDMIVMAGEGRVFVPGEIRLYLNGEPAYVLKDESAYYEEQFCFGSSFWEEPFMADLDNDGSLELLFAAGNGGNGGPGGRNTCLFRRVGNKWVECLEELPNDCGEWCGDEIELHIDVTCTGVNRYEAYCPYVDERMEFDGQNIREIGEHEYGRVGGANVRGFFGFERVTYKGKNAIKCREYLSGEGGNAHGVGEAVFILVWDTDGVCRVADWWVEGWM